MKDEDLLLIAGVGLAAFYIYPKLKKAEDTISGYAESTDNTARYIYQQGENALNFIPDTIKGIVADLTPKTWDNSIPKQGEGGTPVIAEHDAGPEIITGKTGAEIGAVLGRAVETTEQKLARYKAQILAMRGSGGGAR